MTHKTLKSWSWVHRWSSIVCTAFMLLLCLTGLPLIFQHEIGELLGTEVATPVAAQGGARPSLDRVLAIARAEYPERIVQYVSQAKDSADLWFVTLTPTPDPTDDYRTVVVDARSGEVLAQPRSDRGFMWVVFKLHVDLFAGLAGKLFLGLMGLLLLLSIVSGAVLYRPFMRKLAFGTVRSARQPRLKWLDRHNLLGIVTLVWLFVVGATGIINTWADLIVRYWQHDQLSALLAPYQGQATLPVAARGSLERSLQAALRQAPETTLSFIAFPGTAYSSPHHTTFFLRGNQPFTSHLLQPVLVDARTTEVSAAPRLPWYLTTLLLSQPLHFGDYGGRAMQILWALLDMASIIVLGSGIYLWLKKSRPGEAANGAAIAAGRA